MFRMATVPASPKVHKCPANCRFTPPQCSYRVSSFPFIVKMSNPSSKKVTVAKASLRSKYLMLSGTLETPGEIKNGRKQYRGMASKSAQVSWRGGVPEGMAAEGESTYVGIKGRAKDVVLELTGGIRSGMSYVNATSIAEIRDKARFIEMSSSGASESRAHGLGT